MDRWGTVFQCDVRPKPRPAVPGPFGRVAGRWCVRVLGSATQLRGCHCEVGWERVWVVHHLIRGSTAHGSRVLVCSAHTQPKFLAGVQQVCAHGSVWYSEGACRGKCSSGTGARSPSRGFAPTRVASDGIYIPLSRRCTRRLLVSCSPRLHSWPPRLLPRMTSRPRRHRPSVVSTVDCPLPLYPPRPSPCPIAIAFPTRPAAGRLLPPAFQFIHQC